MPLHELMCPCFCLAGGFFQVVCEYLSEERRGEREEEGDRLFPPKMHVSRFCFDQNLNERGTRGELFLPDRLFPFPFFCLQVRLYE
mmetsp:Transcript_45786/g.90174  ORF Transcript_45786/g.90174 Transcript_45786/m.90174 type:complete len:86 (+) Transcript_45786:727-984(+)